MQDNKILLLHKILWEIQMEDLFKSNNIKI